MQMIRHDHVGERCGALVFFNQYIDQQAPAGSLATATQLQGKALSYNNIADADAAVECVKQFDEGAACVIVKHANPCGVAVATDIGKAYQLAFATDPESAFGGIIAFNEPLDALTAQEIIERFSGHQAPDGNS